MSRMSIYMPSWKVYKVFKKYCLTFISLYLISTNMDKIFETISSFHVRQRTTGKVQFLFLRRFLLVLTKFLFWEDDWALGYNSTNFWHFHNIPQFPKILSLKSFSNLCCNLYIPCLLIIITLHFTCGDRRIW